MAEISPNTIHLIASSDDEDFDAWYSVFKAANTFDRGPAAPVWPKSELSAQLGSERASRTNELYLVHSVSNDREVSSADDVLGHGCAIGAIALTIPLKDNLHRVELSLYVEPHSRRRGWGTEMLEFVRSRTKELGRRVIAAEVFRPFEKEAATEVPGIAFAEPYNAEENQHMLAINRELGFRPVERIEEVELTLDS